MPRPSAHDLAKAPLYAYATIDPETQVPVAMGGTFRAVRDGDVVWTNQGERVDLGSFVADAVRCTETGGPVTALAYPLHAQYHALAKAAAEGGEDVEAHLDDVRALRAAHPDDPSAIEDVQLRSDLHMMDALAAGLRDRPVDPPQAERGPDPLIKLMSRETRVEEGQWRRLADEPAFQAEAFRAMARAMLAPSLGNAASLEDLRVLYIPPTEVERAGAIRRWVAGCGNSREIAPMSHPAMPGYVTGVPVLAERDDVTLLSFRDQMGTYAYVWKTTPDVVLDAGPDEDDEPLPGMGW